MRLATRILTGFLGAQLVIGPAMAQEAAPARGGTAPSALELIEDLRILTLLNVLQPTREQSERLAEVAAVGRASLAAIDAEVKSKLDSQRERLLSARERVLRGAETPPATDAQLMFASRAAEATRAQKTEALIGALIGRVRRILTPQQALRIESDLAPTLEQPWRKYARVLSGPAPPAARGSARLPADPGRWLKELRDLRIDSAEGDPKFEVEDFAKKLTRGLRTGTPLFDQSYGQARTFAAQVLALPPPVFDQREIDLARVAARQELETRNQQRVLEGKPTESFDAYRWFVEEVLFSPRAATDLRERAAALAA